MSPITINPTGNKKLQDLISFVVNVQYPNMTEDKALSQYLLDTYSPEENIPTIENNDPEFWKTIEDARKREPVLETQNVEEIMSFIKDYK